jgi:RNA polymerase sigma factor (sigma-70 family)
MSTSTTTLAEATDLFVAERRQLLGIAQRVLGRVGDAEDVVQDAWVRWQRYDWDAVDNPGAFLSTTTTRLAINTTQSARVRRETALPEHEESTVTAEDPTLRAERTEAVAAAVAALDAMTPTERAAFVLREALGYGYDRIAEVVGSTEVNARQLASRGRRRLGGAPREMPVPAQHRRLLDAFLAAAEHGDLHRLETVLRDDIARSRPPAPVIRLDPVERRAGGRRPVPAREPEQLEGLGA